MLVPRIDDEKKKTAKKINERQLDTSSDSEVEREDDDE